MNQTCSLLCALALWAGALSAHAQPPGPEQGPALSTLRSMQGDGAPEAPPVPEAVEAGVPADSGRGPTTLFRIEAKAHGKGIVIRPQGQMIGVGRPAEFELVTSWARTGTFSYRIVAELEEVKFDVYELRLQVSSRRTLFRYSLVPEKQCIVLKWQERVAFQFEESSGVFNTITFSLKRDQ